MFELLKQYEYTIYYIPRKENGKVDIFSKRNKHIKTKKIFKFITLKVNKNCLPLINKYDLSIIICIKRDN